MHRRATSKKRVAEAEKEIDMEDKDATPVEDMEMILPPAEPTKPLLQEKHPENPPTHNHTNGEHELTGPDKTYKGGQPIHKRRIE